MAKIKLNLRGADWKGLLLSHGEKLGIAIVGLVVLALVFFAIQREGMPDAQAPSDLLTLADSARSHIARTDWEAHPERPELPPIGPQSIMKPLDLDPYKTTVVYDPALFEKKSKREDPTLIAPVELEIDAGYGPFAFDDPNAGQMMEPRRGGRPVRPTEGTLFGPATGRRGEPGLEMPLIDGDPALAESLTRPLPEWLQRQLGGVMAATTDVVRGQRWVVVNALVPVGKQRDEFERVFIDAEGYDPLADQPTYLFYFVERADVTDNPQSLNWQPLVAVTPKELENQTSIWSKQATAVEVIDSRYYHPVLTAPLGPLVMRNWGADAKHSKIPFAPTEEELQELMEEQMPVEDAPVEEAADDPFGEFSGRRNELEEGGPRRPAPRGVPRPAPGMRSAPGMRGGPGMLMEGGMRGYGMQGGGMEAMDAPKVPHLMLRFFDYTVEPGKKYRYRFRMVMTDPNYLRTSGDSTPTQVEIKHLEKSVIDRLKATQEKMRRFRFTDWSEPSPVAQLPLEKNVLAAGIEPPGRGRFNDRPAANLLVKSFDVATGTEAAHEKQKMLRSNVTKFTADIEVVDPVQRQLIKQKDYKFEADFTVIDMAGGDRLSTRDPELTAPGEVLLLDPEGGLRVQNEIEDAPEVLLHRDIRKEADPATEGNLFGGLEGAPPPEGIEGGLLDEAGRGRTPPRGRTPRPRQR